MAQPSYRGITFRQKQADVAMREYLAKKPKVLNDGPWRWEDYGVEPQGTSVVVIGEHVRGDRIEIVYLVTLQSEQAIPHFGRTGRVQVKADGSQVTFTQIGHSFAPNASTVLMTTYMGSEPPTPNHPP